MLITTKRTEKLGQGQGQGMERLHYHPRHRSGFTLVELLTVIAIIGILVGLIVPAVMSGLKAARNTSMAMQTLTLASALDKYKEKYGEYPPDGSNWTALQRHLRKVFPQIAATELSLLDPASSMRACNASTLTGAVMDPPEALVFFLGGFSDDPVHPFTGAGGPFAATPSGSTALLQYNIDRNAPFYEFKDQLSVEVVNDPGSGLPITVSNDERDFGLATMGSFPGDLIPVHRASGLSAPFVYFNSNTYATAAGYNFYQGTGIGTARPYKSGDKNTTQLSNWDKYYRYAEEGTFQLICAGLDDRFGGDAGNGSSFNFYEFPSGKSLNIFTTPQPTEGQFTRYQVSGEVVSAQLDNCTNFSEGILENALE
jgi:prepilin-type N-terminal cleavage/methylation domain-containing protein